jgi:hypothetical protein
MAGLVRSVLGVAVCATPVVVLAGIVHEGSKGTFPQVRGVAMEKEREKEEKRLRMLKFAKATPHSLLQHHPTTTTTTTEA